MPWTVWSVNNAPIKRDTPDMINQQEPYDIAKMLEALCHPSAEAMSDSARLTQFCNVGYEATLEIKELRARLAKLEATLKHV